MDEPRRVPATKSRLAARGKHNALLRHRGAQDPATVAAARDLKAVGLAEHVRRVVDGFPPLTPEQRDEISALLRTAPAKREEARTA